MSLYKWRLYAVFFVWKSLMQNKTRSTPRLQSSATCSLTSVKQSSQGRLKLWKILDADGNPPNFIKDSHSENLIQNPLFLLLSLLLLLLSSSSSSFYDSGYDGDDGDGNDDWWYIALKLEMRPCNKQPGKFQREILTSFSCFRILAASFSPN